MTIERTVHPYRNLLGKAFVTLNEEVISIVRDERWEEFLGTVMHLPGGCELDADDAELERALAEIEECDEDWEDASKRRPDLFLTLPFGPPPAERKRLLLPFIVNDADMPPVHVLVDSAWLKEALQVVAPGAGAHAHPTDDTVPRYTICRHEPHEFGKTKCRGCFRRWWTIQARKAGLIDG